MQISAPRLPQTPQPSRPDAASARATVAAVTAALTTATAGDGVELSAAAIAASDRLTAGQPVAAQQRPLPGDAAYLLPSQSAAEPQAPAQTIKIDSTTTGPRPEHLLYAPRSSDPAAPPSLPMAWSGLSQFARISLLTVTFALAILLGAIVS